MLARDPTQRAAKRHFWAPYAIPTTLPGLIFASSPLPANAWVQGGHVLRERAAVTINAEDPEPGPRGLSLARGVVPCACLISFRWLPGEPKVLLGCTAAPGARLLITSILRRFWENAAKACNRAASASLKLALSRFATASCTAMVGI